MYSNIIQGYLPDLKKVLIKMIDRLAIEKQLVLQEALFSDFYKHLTYLMPDSDSGGKP